MSDYKCQVNISKHLQKSSLGTCEKEYLSQKPAFARGAHPIREQRLVICVRRVPTFHSPPQMPFQLPAPSTSSHTQYLLTEDYSRTSPQQQSCVPDRPQKIIPCSQFANKTHGAFIPAAPCLPKHFLRGALILRIPDLHKGGCVLTQTTTWKVSA